MILQQDIAFSPELRRDQFEAISRRLHDLLAYQLKYQSHLASMQSIIDTLSKEHIRFRQLVEIPDHVFDRNETNLQRLKLQANSIYEHSIRMEKQTNNIQKQVSMTMYSTEKKADKYLASRTYESGNCDKDQRE